MTAATDRTHEATVEPQASGLSRFLVAAVSKYALVLVLVALAVVFTILRPNTFPTADNFTSIAVTFAMTLIIALAVVPPLVIGEFDLSVAATFGLAHVIVAKMVLRSGFPTTTAIGVALLVGLAVGLINGLLVVRFKVSSFVATLGMLTILTGVTSGYTAGEQILERAQEIGGREITYRFPSWFISFGQAEFLGITMPFWYAVIIVLGMWFLLSRTATGRRLIATGGNREAALLSGINTNRAIMATFVACSLIASLAGLIMTARLGRGLSTISSSFLLPAYAGAFLGATTVKPGRFNAIGTFVGVYFVGMTVTGLQQLGAKSWVQDVFNGGALITAVIASGFLARTRAAKGKQPSLPAGGPIEAVDNDDLESGRAGERAEFVSGSEEVPD